MQFVKMIQFTLLVKADGRLREFNFKKLRDPAEESFSVNVCNDRGDRVFFNMYKKDNGWKVQPGELPTWVMQNEKKLQEAVEDELKNWQ